MNLWTADGFKDGFHSLDVWHKAKSIRKCLLKVDRMNPFVIIDALIIYGIDEITESIQVLLTTKSNNCWLP